MGTPESTTGKPYPTSARSRTQLRATRVHPAPAALPARFQLQWGPPRYSIFELRLCPEFDFQQEILSKTPEIEVLSPEWLREEIAGKIKILWEKYQEKSK